MLLRIYRLLPSWVWIWIGLGVLIHVGTAILRLNAFFPAPALVDFAAFYTGAWALRLGESPFVLSSALLAQLSAEAGLPFPVPIPFNPPFWYVLLMPLTWLSYPAAAWIWVLVNLGLLGWISQRLASLAGYGSPLVKILLFPIVVTFGPIFLDLTLGQVSVVLLFTALLVGRLLPNPAQRSTQLAGIVTMMAAMIKVYPLMWMGIFPLMHRWRAVVIGLAFLIMSTGLFLLFGSPAVLIEWTGYLQDRIILATDRPSVDDQSLLAWLDRIGRSQTYAVPGLSATTLDLVEWHMPWEVNSILLRWIGYPLIVLMLGYILGFIWSQRGHNLEAGFYLWLLVGLIVFPHTERYNHALLLPAMAWLWSRNDRGKMFVCLAYFLTALARLTHLWVRILPAPWAAIITGSGLLAVFLLSIGIILELRRSAAMAAIAPSLMQTR
jgi:hypothetical protein